MRNKASITAIPRLDLCALSRYGEDDLHISRFADYLQVHQDLVFPHRHSFFQIVYFSSGSGSHTIDFQHFRVVPGQIYFMIPGQVHSWDFEGDMDGYLVNFSDLFFRSFLLRADYLRTFSFMSGIPENGVLNIGSDVQARIISIFEELVTASGPKTTLEEDFIRILLLELFVRIENSGSSKRNDERHPAINQTVRAFRELVEEHFLTQRLPGQYATMLAVTPNHLNALCKENTGMQAGELIRNRVGLEAKRLLINMNLTIAEIAYALNFQDNSYFTKFFKKQEGLTPEEFRRKSVGH